MTHNQDTALFLGMLICILWIIFNVLWGMLDNLICNIRNKRYESVMSDNVRMIIMSDVKTKIADYNKRDNIVVDKRLMAYVVKRGKYETLRNIVIMSVWYHVDINNPIPYNYIPKF